MLSKSDVEYIKQFERSKRKFYDYTNYFFLFFPTLFLVMGLSVLNSYIKNDAKNELIFISFLMIFVGIILMYFTSKRLGENMKFLAIENYNNFNLVDLKSKLENNFKITDLHFDKKMGVIIINTQLTGFSWGEVITIILIGNKYLVNSRPNGQPITLYKDRKNVKKISAILRYNN